MIHQTDVIPLFLDICPTFQPVWQSHRTYWGDEEAGGYMDIAEAARHLVDLAQADSTECFSAVFAVVERLITDGDDDERGLAIVGLLDGIQNVSLNRGIDPAFFFRWLGPHSRAAWDHLNILWEGKNTLMDVLRAEAENGPDAS